LGVGEAARPQIGGGAVYRIVGCEQVPGTNRYLFVIETKTRKISFDIITGKAEPVPPVMCG
jgi:hypothetical protein